MSSKSPVRSCEDVDESVLSYAEIKALCAGNPLIKEKMDLDIEVARLRVLKSDYQSQRFRLEDDLLKNFPARETEIRERITGIEKDIALYQSEKQKTAVVQPTLTENGEDSQTITAIFHGMTIDGVEYTEKEPAAKALMEVCKKAGGKVTDKKIGTYMGFAMSLDFEAINNKFNLLLRGSMTYKVELGSDSFGNITRINNALTDLPKRLEGAKNQLETLISQQDAAKSELEKPFMLADELEEKEKRLVLLNTELNIDGEKNISIVSDSDERTENNQFNDYYDPGIASKSVKPSLLEGIRSMEANKQQSDSGKKTTEHDI
jgi:hypothetical protein